MQLDRQVWNCMAGVWELFETMGTAAEDLDDFEGLLASPMLVVGSGQGLLVRALRDRGHDVHGVDSSRRMAERASQRRGTDTVVADAAALPFASAGLRTVLLATGVLDATRPARIARYLVECSRVLAPEGTLVLSFPAPSEEDVQGGRDLGYVRGYRQDWCRLRALWQAGHDPAAWARLVAAWTGRSIDQASRVVDDRLATLDALVSFLDRVVAGLAGRGDDPTQFFEAMSRIGNEFFSTGGIHSVLQGSDLRPILWRYAAARGVVNVAARPVRGCDPGPTGG
jgi:SAM-dependent methyltransferase